MSAGNDPVPMTDAEWEPFARATDIESVFVTFDDELIARLIAESQGWQQDGCCSSDTWRGHLCQYHAGYRDALELVSDRLRDRRGVWFNRGTGLEDEADG